MKRVTNTYKEPLVITMLVNTPGKRVPDRTQENLLVGKHRDVEDDAVGPELLLMKKKGRVTIEDIKVVPKMEPPGTVEVEVIEKKPPPKDEPMEDEDIKKLEQELLQEHHDPQEG